jgi:hypothetical protein
MKILARILILSFIFFALLEPPTYYTKELFGNRRPVAWLSSTPPTGLIAGKGGWAFLIISRKSGDGYTCNIHQVGRKMGDYDAAGREIVRPIPCYVWENERGGFDGWIEFRGSQRLFCGGGAWDNLSPRCRIASESD